MESTGGTALTHINKAHYTNPNINTILPSYILTSKYMRTIKGLLTKTLKIIKLKTILFNILHFIQLKIQKKITVLNEEEIQQLDKIHQINNMQEITCSINNRTTPHHSTEMATLIVFKQIILNKSHSAEARQETELLTILCINPRMVITQ